jgi:dipeptidase E
MKLLLTSAGITNQSIANAFLELVGKPANEIKVAFIPTAMNVEKGNKEWFINDLIDLKNLNLKSIDIVDISALPKAIWLERIKDMDVLLFSGGNTGHLMNWITQSRLQEILPELLKTKVWVGISAGSMVTNPSLHFSSKDAKIYYEDYFGYSKEEALNFTNFYVRPHFNSPHFPHANKEIIGTIAKEFNVPVYALDDQSALKVIDGKIEVISEGEWIRFN